MTRRTKAAGRVPTFADALQASIETEKTFLRATARRLNASAESLERMVNAIWADYPPQARRLNRLVGELRAVAAELAADAGDGSP